ncbi:hypothetical protein OIV83_001252 [Microbotryomycetes sp. JL201]|nr:hypothetical protein OIV83_001252 [Microbotryomycetes sp. JL201]
MSNGRPTALELNFDHDSAATAGSSTPTSPTSSSPWRRGSRDLPQESLAVRRYKTAVQRPARSNTESTIVPDHVATTSTTTHSSNVIPVPEIGLQAASPTVLKFPSPSSLPPPPLPSGGDTSATHQPHTGSLPRGQVLQNKPERTTSLAASHSASSAPVLSKATQIPSSPPPLSRSYAPTIPSPLSSSVTSEFPFPHEPMDSVSEENSRAVSPVTPRRPSEPELKTTEPLHSSRQRSHSGDYTSPSAQSSHWRTSSSVSTASISPALSGRAPLTPPESSGTGRHLTAAADLAWNDVLGGLGTLSFTGLGGISPAAAGTGSGSGSKGSQVPRADNLMTLEGDDLEMKRSLPLGINHNNNGNATHSRSGTPTEDMQRVGKELLMLGSGGGHFGAATRERLSVLIEKHIGKVPISPNESVIHIVEYGALDSRSPMLVPPVLSHFASRRPRSPDADDVYTESAKTLPAAPISFQVTHSDKANADFRPLSRYLESSTESYLNSSWLSTHEPTLENRVFSFCSSRPFASKVVPPGSVSFGFSAMALHWLSTDKKFRMPPATMAHGELMAFLSSRAYEFKPGGLFVMAYIARSEREAATAVASNTAQHALNRGSSLTAHPHSLNMSKGGAHSSPATPAVDDAAGTSPSGSPSRPTVSLPPDTRPMIRERSTSSPAVPVAKRKDIWDVMSGFLGKAIQRLVSTQLLKPAVARLLLTLPIHPRSPKQTQAVLKSMSHAWTIEEDEILLLSHPAWKGLEHQTVSPSSYADHTIQLIKIFWESEMRSILRDSMMSRAACEWTLDSLWSVVREKIEEEGPQPLELEVQVVALRRKHPQG